MTDHTISVGGAVSRVRVKNTFLDDWEDEDAEYACERQASGRACHTCPAFTKSHGSEPEQASNVCPEAFNVEAFTETTQATQVVDPDPQVAPCHTQLTEPKSVELSFAEYPSLQKAAYARADLPAKVHISEVVEDRTTAEQSRRQRNRGRGKNGKYTSSAVDVPQDESATTGSHNAVDAPHSRSGRTTTRGGRSKNRLWCNLYINESMQKPGFELNKKIIGHGGQGTKRIYDATGAKIRLRGRGSGHLEGGGVHEAPVHLMLSVTAEHWEADNFRKAFAMCVELLQDVEKRFTSFCRQRNHTPCEPCFWVGEIASEARACVQENDSVSWLLHDDC